MISNFPSISCTTDPSTVFPTFFNPHLFSSFPDISSSLLTLVVEESDYIKVRHHYSRNGGGGGGRGKVVVMM